MAFFKSRKAGDDSAASPRQPESIEAMRRRARHRLIGAVVLVLAGVIGFPILFDTQPRPVAVDIPIEIPDRSKVKPLALPRAEPRAAGTVAPSAAASGRIEAAAQEETDTAKAPVAAGSAVKPETKPVAKAEPAKAASADKPSEKPQLPASDTGSKARALLEGGRPAAEAAAADGRFVVQVGAFADAVKARDARLRVEKAGLKTYTNIAETKDGKRIRVRVGPFARRAEADKAAEKIKGLDLPAAILTL
jgi:DedD protein